MNGNFPRLVTAPGKIRHGFPKDGYRLDDDGERRQITLGQSQL